MRIIACVIAASLVGAIACAQAAVPVPQPRNDAVVLAHKAMDYYQWQLQEARRFARLPADPSTYKEELASLRKEMLTTPTSSCAYLNGIGIGLRPDDGALPRCDAYDNEYVRARIAFLTTQKDAYIKAHIANLRKRLESQDWRN